MVRPVISEQVLRDHVAKLGAQHPPIRLDSVDYTVKNPELMRRRYAGVLDYLARVELEVDRNVLELLTIMPHISEIDRFFYQDVWQPQEIAHGMILDTLKQELGLPPAQPRMEISPTMKILGRLAHLQPIQDVARFMYYLTGAATEREAVLAYSALINDLKNHGETAIEQTLIHRIKQQEPGHFAFYRMSAEKMIQDGQLAPWQLWLTRLLRHASFEMVGADGVAEFRRRMGGVIVTLGFANDDTLEQFAKDIGRFEASLLYTHRDGIDYPPYILAALKDCLARFRADPFGCEQNQ